MLKQRIFTALLLASLVLWALFGLADDYLIVLFSVVLLVGTYEWLSLAEISSTPSKILFLTSQAALFASVWWLTISQAHLVVPVLVSIILCWFMILFWLVLYQKGKINIRLNQPVRVLLGLVLLPVCLLGVSFILYKAQHDRVLILFMFMLIWGADVAAYFSGRAFGKNKLASAISPGKSWEGVIGALVGTMVISAVFAVYMGYDNKLMPGIILIALLVVSLSIVGDLFESLLKRQVGIKDSSNILPGHGGILDRIDSMIAASPVFSLGMYSLGLY